MSKTADELLETLSRKTAQIKKIESMTGTVKGDYRALKSGRFVTLEEATAALKNLEQWSRHRSPMKK